MKKVGWIAAMVAFLLLGDISGAMGARKIKFVPLSKEKKHRPITVEEIAVRPDDSSSYTQSWIIWGWNKEGYVFYGLMVITKIVMGTRLGVQLTLRNPQGKVVHQMLEYPKGKFFTKEGKVELWVPNKHRFFYDGKKGLFYTDFGKWGCKLRFTKEPLPGYRFTGGPVRFGSKKFIGIIFAPKIKIRGYLFFENKKVKFEGMGYADHSWQDIMPHRASRRWFSLRAYDEMYSVNATHLLPSKQWKPSSIPGLFIAKNDKWIFKADHRSLRFIARKKKLDKESGYKIPMLIIYKGKKDGLTVTLKAKQLELYDKMDVLSQFNPVLKFIIQKLFSKPYIFRYRTKVELTIKTKRGTKKRTLYGFTEWAYLNP